MLLACTAAISASPSDCTDQRRLGNILRRRHERAWTPSPPEGPVSDALELKRFWSSRSGKGRRSGSGGTASSSGLDAAPQPRPSSSDPGEPAAAAASAAGGNSAADLLVGAEG